MLNNQPEAVETARAPHHHHQEHAQAEAPTFTELLPSVLHQLVGANLSAAGYRVVLDTLARFLIRGTTSEAVPVEWMADRLNLSRNTIGFAYQTAETAGLVRRIPVAERGAPTRTALQGALLRLMQVHQTPSNPVASPTRRFAAAKGRAATAWRAGGTKGERQASRDVASQNHEASRDAHGPSIVQVVHVDHPEESSIRHDATTELDHNAPQQQSSPAQSSPGETNTKVVHVNHHEEAVVTTRVIPAVDTETAATPLSPKLTPAEMQKALESVPMDARVMATLADSPKRFVIDPAWNLTELQIQALRMLLPTPEMMRPRPNSVPRTQTGGRVAHGDIVKALRGWMSRLENLVGKGRAPLVADEIAFQVQIGLLGQGDQTGGVRAGLSLVAKGQWRTPRGFSTEWVGAVDRGWLQMHADVGDAQKTVH